jgi:excisionase family DNA binding protein
MSKSIQERTDDSKLLLKASEVADRLSVGRATAYELMAAGTLPTVRIGRSIRVPAGSLSAFIERSQALADKQRDAT